MITLHRSNYTYFHQDQRLEGYLAYDTQHHERRPAVLVVHDWSGRNAFACNKADLLAKLGYVGFAVDMYGDAQVADTVEEKKKLMEAVSHDRHFLRERIHSALKVVQGLEQVDHRRIAAIGFCFGGLCVLDLARYGADILGAVCFHGLLNKPDNIDNQHIKAKILALQGYDDPMVPPEQINAFCEEMNNANVDWQIHWYGHTQHAFSNPLANDKDMGTVYNAIAERRSMRAMTDFLNEIFS